MLIFCYYVQNAVSSTTKLPSPAVASGAAHRPLAADSRAAASPAVARGAVHRPLAADSRAAASSKTPAILGESNSKRKRNLSAGDLTYVQDAPVLFVLLIFQSVGNGL